MIAAFYLPDDISCDAAFGACKQASQASAALSFLERIQQVGASVLFLQEQNNCKSLLESVDFIRLPDGYSLFTSFHIFSHHLPSRHSSRLCVLQWIVFRLRDTSSLLVSRRDDRASALVVLDTVRPSRMCQNI